MSVKKFKVGDKVRVREGLVAGTQYGEQTFVGDMERMMGCVVTIDEVLPRGYLLKGSFWWKWTDEMLESVEKTLENLERGDLVKYRDVGTRKVLAVLDGCYLLSNLHDHLTAGGWHTPYELEVVGWKFVQPEEAATETIEVGGKKYNKQEFEEAVKDLEPID